MIVLAAYYKGTVDPANREAFDAYVRDVHLPLVAQWPELRALRLLLNNHEPYLGEAPQYYHCFQLFYDDKAALSRSLGSEAREETKRISLADRPRFRDLFQGEVLHMVFDITAFPCKDRDPSPKQDLTGAFARCALYMGTVPEQRERFETYVSDVHLPMVAEWPRLKDLKLLKSDGTPFLTEPPRYFHAFELYFDTQEDMDLCMASDERKETRRISAQDVDSFKGLFEGEVHHVNFRITDFPLRPTR
ncbi:EthD family reductase [Rhodoligotrophos defluvii]|uniref:EthD family reductase n=1 Tax=Rhodoligotrophos defluvii TaxID=2561934 RepID=UPI0010C9C8B7|nr:EthD family reductase [Rhodoligotrophos defluvii]